MKILYVVQNYYPSIGGTQILFQNLAERSKDYYNDEAVVYTTNSYIGPDKKEFLKIEKNQETINGIQVFRFPFIKFHYWLSSKIILFLKVANITVPQIIQRYRSGPWSPSLQNAINETDADVIFGSSSSYLFMLYPLLRHKLKNPKPFVFQGSIHFSENEEHNVLFTKTLQAINASEYYISNTNYEKERLIKLGVDANKIVVTGTAVDMQIFEQGKREYYRSILGLGQDDILVGYIGRIEATKGIDVLIDSFLEARKSNPLLHLVIAGFKSNYANQIEATVQTFESGIREKISFVYNLSVQEKANLYHAIDIYVLPSINESFGMVFLEAWSCKKPVIGADIGAIRSVISNGIDGLLMQPTNVNDLKEKILLLSNDKNLRTKLGLNGFTKTVENYTWPVIVKKYRDVFVMAKNKFNV